MPNTELEKYYLEITKCWYDPILFWLGYKFERLPRYMEVDVYKLKERVRLGVEDASTLSWIKDLRASFLRDRLDKKLTEWSNIPRRTFVQEDSRHKPGEVPATEYWRLSTILAGLDTGRSTREDAVTSFLTTTCGLLVSGLLPALTFFIYEPTIEVLLVGMFMFGFTISPFIFVTIVLLDSMKPIDAIRELKLPAFVSLLISILTVICLASQPV